MTVEELEKITLKIIDKSTPVIFSTFSMHQVENISIELEPKDNDYYDRDTLVICAEGI